VALLRTCAVRPRDGAFASSSAGSPRAGRSSYHSAMNVLHVIYSMNPSHGGPPRVVARLAVAQQRLGCRVSILCYGSEDELPAIKEMTATIPGGTDLSIRLIPALGCRETLFASRAGGVIAEELAAADVLHLHNFWSSILRVAADKAHQSQKAYFIQPNGALDRWPRSQKWLKKRMALALKYRSQLERAWALSLGNQDEADGLADLGLSVRRVITPLNAIFPDEIPRSTAPAAFSKAVPALRGRPFALFLGRLHYKKGLDILAEAFAIAARRHHDLCLVVVGHDEGAREPFRQRIERAGLTDRVIMTGPLHGTAKWQAYRAARCFILPSRQEGFSIAITEALASGCPVVITDQCHFGDVATCNAGYVVRPEPPRIADALSDLHETEARRLQMSENGVRLVAEQYRLPDAVLPLVDEYRRACGAGKGVTA